VPLVVALALAVTGLASCGDDDGGADDDGTTGTTTRSSTVSEETSTTSATPAPLTATGDGALAGVTLTAELTVDGDVARIAYRLDNQSGQPVALADAVPVAAGSGFSPDPDGAWVTASTQGIVTVGKWPISQPTEAGGDRAEPQHLYLVRVEAGARAEGQIELGWPLTAHHPYYPADALPVPLPDPVASVRLCVGAEPLTPAIERAPVVQDGDATWLDVPMDQLTGTLCTEPAAVT
jgi:hypothetical protein